MHIEDLVYAGVQWGLKNRTFNFRIHLKTEPFIVPIWDGQVFEWSVPVHRMDHLKTELPKWPL